MDDPIAPLNAAEARVLGALIEKQITTPDYYPLTLNALTNACNQLTNRDPVVAFDESTVVRALDGLREKRLATLFTGQESRVAKYKHSLTDALLLTPAEVALLCVLLLRGPQTIGEIRINCDRLHRFADTSAVEGFLDELALRPAGALVMELPRQAGARETRWCHLLSGAPAMGVQGSVSSNGDAAIARPTPVSDLDDLRAEIARLRADVETLKEALATLTAPRDRPPDS